MENILDGNILNIIIMVVVGAISGTLAARVIRGDNYGFIINAILGIGGAVVGGSIFNFLGITPGRGIVKTISNTFGVDLPLNIVGMIVSATLGAILILWAMSIFKSRKTRR